MSYFHPIESTPVSYSKFSNRGYLARLTSARTGTLLLMLTLAIGYVLLPLAAVVLLDFGRSFSLLAMVACLTILSIAFGSRCSIFDRYFSGRNSRIALDAALFHTALWSAFIAFVLVALGTAERIPLLAALAGADAETIAVLREQFLKAREGWQSSFVYINAILSGALIPYSLAFMFLHNMRWRWIAAAFFLLFCVSFVEKAFFFKAALPILYLIAQNKTRTKISPRSFLLLTLLILFLVTYFSGAGRGEGNAGEAFFSIHYAPESAIQHLIWRSIAIPLVTAADALQVFERDFGGRPLLGATSSFIAVLFSMERIEFERLVFAMQWGQNQTGTGSSNSVFFTEAFVNFGWFGLVSFGFLSGLLMRFFSQSHDDALKATWPLFALGLYTSGLIGLMLSNGFLLLFLSGIFLKFRLPYSFRLQKEN